MADGLVISSEFIGLMKAQLMVHNKQGGTLAEVREIGPDGLPVEPSNVETFILPSGNVMGRIKNG